MVGKSFHFEINSLEEFVIFCAVLRGMDLNNENDLALLTARLRSCTTTEEVKEPMQELAVTH